MEKILLFGTGKIANEIMPGIIHNSVVSGYRIEGFIDNDPLKYAEKFHGYKVYSPQDLRHLEYSKIIICCDSEKDIKAQLLNEYGINVETIKNRWFLLKLIMKNKYKKSNNYEIRSILKYWNEKDECSVFNNFIDENNITYDEVIWDRNINLPYISFRTVDEIEKKMYFPRNYLFDIVNGKQMVRNLMKEQEKRSPHRYVFEEHDVYEGDVVLDVGVCEGNFALRYINIAKKIYLFECNPFWEEPLFHTFKNDKNKVVLTRKFVTDRTGSYSIKIDDLINEKINFLKMDIEGNEANALIGAEKTLRNNNVKCSICSYHRYGDEQRIKNFLNSCGYQTSNSNGYMTFLYDSNIFYHADFRRGIVYGYK